MFWQILTKRLPQLARFRLAYEGLADPPAPLNLTYSITNACNSRCQTCDIWSSCSGDEPDTAKELSLDEVETAFRNIGNVYFFNISGGEPFLRKDIVQIVELACRYLDPKVIHIPTNGLLPKRIERLTRQMLNGLPLWGQTATRLTLKPSFDGVGDFHDWMRGVEGNYNKLVETIGLLKALQSEFDTLGVGLGTVISTMNCSRLPEIIEQANRFDVDTYISEVAEERAEMHNYGNGITPTADEYESAIRPFKENTLANTQRAKGLELLTQAMRYVYYGITHTWLAERRQVIPCFAGITNVHISASGEVWPCAILADSRSFGNLRDQDYQFWKIWHSQRANEVRAGIKAKQCDCPLANQAYANILLSPQKMAEVAWIIGTTKVRGLLTRRGSGVGKATDDVARAAL